MSEFLLLGPFEGPVELPGGKPRALLARLVLDAGRVVPAGTLVDALWDDPPPSAPKALSPQQRTVPSLIRAHTWRSPAASLVAQGPEPQTTGSSEAS